MNDLIKSGLCPPLSLLYLLKSDVSWSRYLVKLSAPFNRWSMSLRSTQDCVLSISDKISQVSVLYHTPFHGRWLFASLLFAQKIYYKSQQVVIKLLAKKIITMDWLKWNPECRHLNSNGAFAYGTHLVLTTFFICAKPNSLSAALIKNAPVFIAAILAVSMWNGPEAHETKYNWKIFQHFLRNMKTDYAALFSRVFQFLMKWSSTCELV